MTNLSGHGTKGTKIKHTAIDHRLLTPGARADADLARPRVNLPHASLQSAKTNSVNTFIHFRILSPFLVTRPFIPENWSLFPPGAEGYSHLEHPIY
jgi:hypothetical protein